MSNETAPSDQSQRSSSIWQSISDLPILRTIIRLIGGTAALTIAWIWFIPGSIDAPMLVSVMGVASILVLVGAFVFGAGYDALAGR